VRRTLRGKVTLDAALLFIAIPHQSVRTSPCPAPDLKSGAPNAAPQSHARRSVTLPQLFIQLTALNAPE
jgi:hypothetical protein